ncbi:MAG: putative metal-binding motif-containing protein, partial [Acidobacteriota bacterium]|nr:putative metal-binding motif-containing protein [Acidobacteriota bacterium]
TDCDDGDSAEFPGQVWYADCDNDGSHRSTSVAACDLAAANGLTPCSDSQAPDGGWSHTAGTDCDDENAGKYPGNTETVADGIDQDCDTFDDCYQDTDTDTYGSSTVITGDDLNCNNTSGEADDNTDCDDSSATTFVGAAPDDNASACMKDDDDDEYGDENPPDGVTAGNDCDDDEPEANPGETEVCDGIDNNCDGTTDEGC